MLLYTFLHSFLNELVQIANKMGLQEIIVEEMSSVMLPQTDWSLRTTSSGKNQG
jgi:hypothetical protein